MTRLPDFALDTATWGAVLNAFLSVGHNADGTLRVVRSAEIDFGATPTGPKEFTITDPAVGTFSQILISQSGAPATTGFGGEAEFDPIHLSAIPGNGVLTVSATPLAGLVVGRFVVAYSAWVTVGIA